MQESEATSETYNGMSTDNIKGLVLALSSSFFIGASFIVKKKGLKKAGSSGVRAGSGGYSYLSEPLWWTGMLTMVVGEIANFAAYAFAPAILVTPLGAVSIIISATLAHVILREKLHMFGILGCVLCVVGSITIVLHAPQERQIESVAEVWDLATEPGFLAYAFLVLVLVFILMINFVPQYGQTHVMVYIGICSLMGSLSVMGVKALGIALKLTFSGMNQLAYPQTWIFAVFVVSCIITQMNYLNKALDTFNTALVSPIYYVMFTSFTILASVIMFKHRIRYLGRDLWFSFSWEGGVGCYELLVDQMLLNPLVSCACARAFTLCLDNHTEGKRRGLKEGKKSRALFFEGIMVIRGRKMYLSLSFPFLPPTYFTNK